MSEGDAKTLTKVKVKPMAKVYSETAKKVLSIGEVAERSGVPVSTLHFYERKGLIHSQRSTGNHRQYAREVLRRVGVIKVAQRVGIPLSEIGAALSTLPDKRAPTARDWERISKNWQQDLNERIERLSRLRDFLDGCIGCGCLSVEQCPLRNPEDELAAEGSGPRFLDPTKKLNRKKHE